MTIDPIQTNFHGDVGDGEKEEIDVIEPGESASIFNTIRLRDTLVTSLRLTRESRNGR